MSHVQTGWPININVLAHKHLHITCHLKGVDCQVTG